MYAKDAREKDAAEAEQILAETNEVFGDCPWELHCRSDLAFLRGDVDYAHSLRHRALDLDPHQDHPRVLLARASLRLDEGDRESAVPQLNQAASSKDADALVHVYLSVLLEQENGDKAANSPGSSKASVARRPASTHEEVRFCRKRIEEGPFADLRRR
jgi:predicted Zn-dependent protease